MSKAIEDTRAILGERIAILADDTRYDPGVSNVREKDVRDAADDYARAVLGNMPPYFFNIEDDHICPEAIQEWLDDQDECITRLRDARR